MKKIIPLLTIILCFAVWFQCVSAETRAVKADTDKKSVAIGGTFELLISGDLKGVSGIQMDIEYDPQNAEYIASELTELFDGALVSGIEEKNVGKITMIAAFTEKCDLSGTLCSAEFKAVDSDIKLKITNIKLMIDGEKTSEEDIEKEIKVKGRRSEGGGNSLSGGSGSGLVNKEEKNEKPENKNDDDKTSEAVEDILPIQKDNKENDKTEKVFDDIIGHWAYDSIMFMYNEGIIKGVGENLFAPDNEVTRAEFATMMAQTLNLEEISDFVYADVAKDSWYAENVKKCTMEKIMLGDGEFFRPDDTVTREEVAAVIFRAAKYLDISIPETKEEKTFIDSELISNWAESAVYDMVNLGIINGYDDGRFGAKDKTTRAQTAVMLSKLLKLQWGEAV